MGSKFQKNARIRSKADTPSDSIYTSSDEEENSSDGDDSIHTSDEEFIDDDSEPNPDDDYAYSTTSESASESTVESTVESAAKSGSELASESSRVVLFAHCSHARSEVGVLTPGSVNRDDDEERAEVIPAMEGLSLLATRGQTEGGGGGILAWLNEQTKLEVSKVGVLFNAGQRRGSLWQRGNLF